MEYSFRFSRHISIWSSPHPAIIFSPVSYIVHWTNGSSLDNLYNPFTKFGKSAADFGVTATRTTGATEYFIDRIEHDS